jgi:G3E family GTPase
MKTALGLLVLAFGVVSCARTIIVHSATSPSARFDAYRTFEFRTMESPPASYGASARTLEACRRIEQEATELLRAKGYSAAADRKPDLVLWVAAGRRERATYSEAVNRGWFSEDEGEDFIEGSFVIDAVDGANHDLLWHGSARTEVDPNGIDENLLRRAVTSVMATFPARGPKG